MPVMVATIRVKSRTVQSSDAISRRGIWGGASPRRALRPANPKQTATPAAPISNTKFSISNCAASRDLRAPRAALTANSRCRAAPRASCMPATFTHAMMRSRATELRRMRRIGRAGAASLSESGVIRASIPARMRLNCGGSSSASARTSAVNSARACSRRDTRTEARESPHQSELIRVRRVPVSDSGHAHGQEHLGAKVVVGKPEAGRRDPHDRVEVTVKLHG